MIVKRNRNVFKSRTLNNRLFNLNDLANYLGNESHQLKWHGVSFQLNESLHRVGNIKPSQYVEAFFNIVSKYSTSDSWIVQPLQPTKLFPWFKKTEKNTSVPKLRALLGTEFKGFIVCSNEEVKSFFEDFFLFSYLTKSQDILVINHTKSLILLLGQHLCLDVISTKKKTIDEVILLLNKYEYEAKVYR
jgi:hypothetical protein